MSAEAEGDPVAALDQANSDNQRIIRRELDARIALEDEVRDLRNRNAVLESRYATYTAADRRLQRERDDAVRGQHLAERRATRLEGELATSERERRRMAGNNPQQAGDIGNLQEERDGLELERNRYFELAQQRQTENQSLQDHVTGLNLQVTDLNLQLQARQALAVAPPVDQSPVAPPSVAAPSFSPISVKASPVVSPPVVPPTIPAHTSPPPAAPRHSSEHNDAAPPVNAVGGSRRGRGRGAASGRAGRGGRGAGTATREKRERACKVKKNYKV